MRRCLIPLVLVMALVMAPSSRAAAGAEPCDPGEAEARTARIQAHLDREKRRARRWDNAWLITFASLAAAQGALVAFEWTPLGEYDDTAEAGLQVGAIKAGVGALAHLVLRLKVVRPRRTGDPCTDLAEAERALRATAKNEKRTFFLQHLGSLAVNVAGLVYLGTVQDSWGEGAKSMAGYPVGVLAVYTQPRGSWKASRRGDFSAQLGIVHRPDYAGLVLAGTF